MFGLKKLRHRYIWERILRERLSEPVHLNLLSLGVALVGSFEQKVYFDLVIRQQNAFALLNAARKAKALDIPEVTAIEFGVANGAGLLNICSIAERVTEATGVRFRVLGLDSGKGMPPPRDARDHPEYYVAGDFPMQDATGLAARLPACARLIIGDVSQTVGEIEPVLQKAPLGFVSIDLDYYWSTVEALRALTFAPELYLPFVDIYLDDIMFEGHSPAGGELLAVEEFTAANPHRAIHPHRMLAEKRLFRRGDWLAHMYTLQVLDHPQRQPATVRERPQIVLTAA
jgi:hypothetical protein